MTEDGGDNWVQQASPFGSTLEGITFTDSKNGWVCGYGGAILHTSTGGITGLENAFPSRPIEAKLAPNPFSQTSRLQVWNQTPGRIQLKVLDLQGKLISTQSTHSLTRGWQEMEFGAQLPKGMYLLQIQTEEGDVHFLKFIKE